LERRLYFRHLLNDETACASMGRRGQIVRLRWRDIDLDVGAIEWGVTEKARKSRAARRAVPAVRPLRAILKCCTSMKRCTSNRASPLQTSCMPSAEAQPSRGDEHGRPCPAGQQVLERRGAPTDRASRMPPHRRDVARRRGRQPKVASVLMGHATPDHQPGAAPITLARCTHTLPDAMERAREQLDAFLAEANAAESRIAAAEIHSPWDSAG
jgi:integrase